MHPDTIKRLRELEEKATKPPWRVGRSYETEVDGRTGFGVHYLLAEHSPYKTSRDHWGKFRSLHGCSAPLYKQDADFLAELRNAAPALLSAAERYGRLERFVRDVADGSTGGGSWEPWQQEEARAALAE